MEEQNKNGEGNGSGNKGGSGTAKITVTAESERLLDEMVKRVNDGFSGGRVTRQDLATWVVRYFYERVFKDCVEEIRADHFDQVTHLEGLLKQAKEARKAGANADAVASILGGAGGPARDVKRKPRRQESLELGVSRASD